MIYILYLRNVFCPIRCKLTSDSHNLRSFTSYYKSGSRSSFTSFKTIQACSSRKERLFFPTKNILSFILKERKNCTIYEILYGNTLWFLKQCVNSKIYRWALNKYRFCVKLCRRIKYGFDCVCWWYHLWFVIYFPW